MATQIPILIDKTAHRNMRQRAAPYHKAFSFLFEHAIASFIERLNDLKCSFEHALIIEGSGGLMAKYLQNAGMIRTKIKTLTEMETTLNFAILAQKQHKFPIIVADAEQMPFAPNSFDLILYPWGLHWMNDLVGTLIQINRALKPNGAFFACMPGSASLAELKKTIIITQSELSHGVSPHILPFPELKLCGDLLKRAHFALPVIDSEHVQLNYRDPWKLWHDLRYMGEGNALQARRKQFTRREFFLRCNEKLHQSQQKGFFQVNFEFVYLHGWHPSPSQPRSKPRGSGKTSLHDIL